MFGSIPQGSSVANIVLGVVVLALLIVMQLRARPVRDNGARITLVLGVIGLVNLVQAMRGHHLTALTVAILAGSLVLAAGFGVARALTVKLWQRDGQVWRRGTWITAVLWAASLAAHLGYAALLTGSAGERATANASILLYLAVSLGLQRALVANRARRIFPGALDGAGLGGGAPYIGARR